LTYFQGNFTILFLLGSLSLLGLWCLRAGGLKLRKVQSESISEEISAYGRFQYPLRLILEWMTGIAIVISCWQTVWKNNLTKYDCFSEGSSNYHFFPEDSLPGQFVFLEISICIVLFWVILGIKNKGGLLMFNLLLCCIAVAYFQIDLHKYIPYRELIDVQFFRVFISYLIIALTIIRLAGYRWVWGSAERKPY
jgi:hypothetical protein